MEKLLAVISFLRFRSLYSIPVFFSYYFLELVKAFALKLNFFSHLRLKTFIFAFLQNLFYFDYKPAVEFFRALVVVKPTRLMVRYIRHEFLLSNILTKAVKLNVKNIFNFLYPVISILSFSPITSIFIVGYLRIKSLNSIVSFIDLCFSTISNSNRK